MALIYALEKLSSQYLADVMRLASCVIVTAAWDKADHIIQVWGSTLSSYTGYRHGDMNNFGMAVEPKAVY